MRPGVLYTSDGKARFGVPAGEYTIHAGRGFEYGIATARVSVKPGDTVRKELTIRREVPTPGYVACDTHVHTLTHSGHGDSTDVERATFRYATRLRARYTTVDLLEGQQLLEEAIDAMLG